MNFSRPLRTTLLGLALVGSTALAADPELASLLAKAEKGNAIAQYNLGLAYAEGRGTPSDRAEAFVWLSLAIENGARGRALDNLASQLTPAELQEARARLADRRSALVHSTPSTSSPSTPVPATTEAAPSPAEIQKLTAELAAAWKEAEQLKAEVERLRSTAAPAPDTEQLRRERDALAAKITDLAGDIATLRTDRERLQKLSAQAQKESSEAREIGRAHQEQARISEMRVAELVRTTEQLKAELGRAQESIAALRAAPADGESLAVAQKARELQAAKDDLASATAVTAELRAALARAGQDYQRLQTLTEQAQAAGTELTAQVATLRAQVAELQQRPAAPAYPDLRERVNELEAQVAALRDAAPAFPDLRGRVAELERQLAATPSSAPTYPDLRARVQTLENGLAAATQTVREADARLATLAESKNAEIQTARTQLSLSQAEAASTRQQLDQARAAVRDRETALAEARRAPAQPQTPAYPDLRNRVAELEGQVAALQAAPAAPAYPDLRGRVATLEQDLVRAANATPAYPDLRDRVAELEQRLAIAQSQLAQATSTPSAGANADELAAKLADTEGRLATALRGYSLLQKEVDELNANAAKATDGLTRERDDLAARLAGSEETARNAQAEIARLTESLAALQRSTGEASAELASARALLREAQGTNTVLARENYDLKTALSRDPARGSAIGTATPPAAEGRTHTVAAGDSLSRISLRYYGNAARWQDIFAANRDVLDEKGTLRVGMTLRIP